VGAQARLQAIDEEWNAILRAFPALRTGRTPASTNGSPAPAGRTRSGCPAQRKAVGERMKAYWAKRRAEKAGTADSQTGSASEASPAAKRPWKRKSGMSAAARKAVGDRMRAYWAARRAGKQAGQPKRASRQTERK
jgi:hypothetical protein